MTSPTEKKVIYEPPSEKVLLEIARKVCERLNCPQSTHDLANFLAVVARARANMLNKLARLDKKERNE